MPSHARAERRRCATVTLDRAGRRRPRGGPRRGHRPVRASTPRPLTRQRTAPATRAPAPRRRPPRPHDDEHERTSGHDDHTPDDDLPGPAGPGFIAGQVTAVGDSVMLDYQDPLKAAIPGIAVDAAVSRQWADGEAILQSLKAEGQLGATVIVGLGTNGPITATDFDTMMAILERRVPRGVRQRARRPPVAGPQQRGHRRRGLPVPPRRRRRLGHAWRRRTRSGSAATAPTSPSTAPERTQWRASSRRNSPTGEVGWRHSDLPCETAAMVQ